MNWNLLTNKIRDYKENNIGKPQRLRVTWTREMADDLMNFHSLETELANQIGQTIDREILNDLLRSVDLNNEMEFTE